MRRGGRLAIAKRDKVEKLIEQLSHVDWIKRAIAAKALGEQGDMTAVPHLIKALADADKDVRWWAAGALGKLGDKSAVPGLITALADSGGYVRRYVTEALGKLGDKTAVPALITALADADRDVRQAAAEALGKIETKPARLKLDFSKDNWPRSGEFAPHNIAISNDGEGPAIDIRLSLAGPAVGRKTSLHLKKLLPGGKVSSTISVCPDAPGSVVPLRWELTFDDVRGLDQSRHGIIYLAVASASGQSPITIGTLVQGSVGGDVVDIDINKGEPKQEESFNACPYCGQALNLPKTPRFCPFCKERLVAD